MITGAPFCWERLPRATSDNAWFYCRPCPALRGGAEAALASISRLERQSSHANSETHDAYCVSSGGSSDESWCVCSYLKAFISSFLVVSLPCTICRVRSCTLAMDDMVEERKKTTTDTRPRTFSFRWKRIRWTVTVLVVQNARNPSLVQRYTETIRSEGVKFSNFKFRTKAYPLFARRRMYSHVLRDVVLGDVGDALVVVSIVAAVGRSGTSFIVKFSSDRYTCFVRRDQARSRRRAREVCRSSCRHFCLDRSAFLHACGKFACPCKLVVS